MRWTFQPALRGVEENSALWDAINERTFASHPFLDSRFVVPLVRHFGTDETVLAVLGGEDGKIEGALLLERRGLGIWQSFLPSQAQIAPAVVPPKRVDALNALVNELPQPVWLLDFLKQDREYSCFRDSVPQNAEQLLQAQTIQVRLEHDFDSYWGTRSKNLRKNMRRYTNRMDKDAIRSSLRVAQAPDDIGEALRRYGNLESQGWKGAAGTAVHPDNLQGRFYQDVMAGFAATGNARAYELYLGGRLAASRLCVSSEDMLVILKTTYDEALSDYAPGRLLLQMLLKSEFESGRNRVVEFYTNATKETLEWASDSRFIAHVSLYRSALVKNGAHFLRQVKARALDRGRRKLPTVEVEGELARNDTRTGRFETCTTYEGFLALEPEWTRCWERDGLRSFFLSHAWFENFIHEVARGDGDFIIYVDRDQFGEPRAIFPMMRKNFGGTIRPRTLTFLANYYSPIAKPIWAVEGEAARLGLAKSFLSHLSEFDRSWDVLELSLLPSNPAGPDDFQIMSRALEAQGVPHVAYLSTVNRYQTTTGLDAASYEAGLPSRVRNTIRRGLKRAARVGKAECRIYVDPEEIGSRIDDYYSVYARSWKRAEPYPGFHRRLAEKMASKGKCLLGVAYLDGKPVAAQIWVVDLRVASILKLAYDLDYKEYSFGTVLTHNMIAFAIDELQVAEIDFLTGDDAYKKDWMSGRRERRGLLAFNRTLRGRLVGFDEGCLKPIAKRVIGARIFGRSRK
jgi:CelD/BcsL family acetyltransferase involved in cellulose biosynthesis